MAAFDRNALTEAIELALYTSPMRWLVLEITYELRKLELQEAAACRT